MVEKCFQLCLVHVDIVLSFIKLGFELVKVAGRVGFQVMPVDLCDCATEHLHHLANFTLHDP